ncbi:MAG: poly(R)-hydroxyalkanoic acid synthase subunit PhaE [Ardenticatenales bacterium]
MSEGPDPRGSMWEGIADAQRAMWAQWADLAASGARTAGQTPAAAGDRAGGSGGGATSSGWMPGTDTWPGATDAWMASWRQMAQQTASAFTAGSDPVAKDMAQAMAAAQETMMRFGTLMQQAWAMMSSPTAAGEGASAPFDAFAKSMQQSVNAPWAQWVTPPGGAQDLWRSYLESLERLPGPWANVLKGMPTTATRAMGGDHSELIGQTRMLWDAWERGPGRIIETPAMGYARESTEKLQRGFDAWVDYRRAVFEYGVVLNEAWAGSGQAAVDMLRQRAETNTPITSLREFVNAWSEATDGSLEVAFRSPRYADAQAVMLAAAMRYRLCERDLVETFLKSTDIPARSELDETNRRLHAVKREVRELRQALAALRAGASGAPTTAPREAATATGGGATKGGTKAKASTSATAGTPKRSASDKEA